METMANAESPEKQQTEWNDMSLLSRAKYMVSKTTVELLLGLYIVSTILLTFTALNLNLQKACRVNLALDNDTCSAMESRSSANGTSKGEKQAQQLVSDMLIWKSIVQNCVPCVLVIFIGSWSDRNRRRKPCLIVPIVGQFFASVGVLVCYYYFYQLPMEVTGIVESIFIAFTGGAITLTLAVFSYIGDISTVETRTLRIGMVNVFTSLGGPIGASFAGYMLPRIGIPGVLITSSVLMMLTTMYGLQFIKEPFIASPVEAGKSKYHNKSSFGHCVKDFFNIQHMKDAIRVTFNEGPYHRRTRIILLLIMTLFIMGPTQGEMAVMYMYTRVQFNWKEEQFSWFLSYSMITNVVGTTISVSLFCQYLKLDDAVVGAMACMSKILGGLIYTFAKTDWVFYLAPIMEMMSATGIVALRSIVTKLVLPAELGQITAVFGVCETLVPVIYNPMYSAIYRNTLNTMPGLCFLVGSSLLLAAMFFFLWIYTAHKKEKLMNGSVKVINENVEKKPENDADRFGSYSKVPSTDLIISN